MLNRVELEAREKCVQELWAITVDDPEVAHAKMDAAILEFVKVVAPAVHGAAEAIKNSAKWWATA